MKVVFHRSYLRRLFMLNLNEKKRLSFMSLFLATVMVSGIQMPKAFAETDLLNDVDESLNAESLDQDNSIVDGKSSPSEILRKKRANLEERNKAMVEKKIEDIRVKHEIALTKQLQKAFNKNSNSRNLKEDRVQVSQAAPEMSSQSLSANSDTTLEKSLSNVKSTDGSEERNIKIIPSFGVASIKGDKIDFESKINIGASVETNIYPQLTVGVGIGYTALDATDTANDFISNTSTVGSIYYNTFGQGRTMAYDKLSLEANTKFFILNSTLIKPFAGASVSFNRSNIKYNDNGNGYTNPYGISYGNEAFTSNSLGASAKIGAEADLAGNVGLNIDLSFSKTLTSGISSVATTTSNNPDQLRLQNVTRAMEQSDIVTVQGGLVVKF